MTRPARIARRKIAPARSPIEEYVDDLEFERELGHLFRDGELPDAATESLRHRITESPDDDE